MRVRPPNAIQERAIGDHGLLRVISNADIDAKERTTRESEEALKQRELREDQIAGHITRQFSQFRNARENQGISQRLLESLRAFRGEYHPSKLEEIKKFGGSKVYSRLSALKCRGATAMLRDIYLAGERAWFIAPTPKPTLPSDVTASLLDLIGTEVKNAEMGGQSLTEPQIQDRVKQLTRAAEKAALSNATDEAEKATLFLDDILVEGKFYDGLVEFLHNMTVFPYAFMKGPTVRMATDVKWVQGEAQTKDIPKMFWSAPSPFDVYWQSGVRDFSQSDVIEHLRLTRSEVSSLLGIPGYNEEAVRAVLEHYGRGGSANWLDSTESERADQESRNSPHMNESDLIDALEFHGKIQGRMLLDYGYTEDDIEDPDLDYFCTAWVIGEYVLKVQIDPSPRKRHPYYMTSFEKIPGSTVGYGLPEILSDIQDVANASLRSLVNNLSIASGPQVVINDDRISTSTDSDALYPWKRWHVSSDPMGSSEPAINFYQPQSNSQELLATYNAMTVVADEVSSIPRYMTGSASGQGGAGRTASGLNMLMQNAGKVLQSVAANVDADIFSPLLQKLYDTVLLTDQEGRLQGDEQIRVRGVVFANQRETERTRMLEFLSLTANPIDSQIVGQEGRAELLREVADRIGLQGAEIVPDKETIKANAMQQMQAGPGGQQPTPNGGAQNAMPPAEAGNVDEGLRSQMRGPSGQTV